MRRDQLPVAERYMQLLNIAETLEGDEAIAAFLLAKRLMSKSGLTLGSLLRPLNDWPVPDTEQSVQRLLKILRLTDSDKQGESIAAFLMSISMMKRYDLSFRDILQPRQNDYLDEKNYYPTIELEIASLRSQLRDMHYKVHQQDLELKRYRTAFDELMDASWALQYEAKPNKTLTLAPLPN